MFLLKLLFKNAFRHKLRSWLTILSVAIAILAFGLLRTVVDGFYSGVKRASVNRLVTRNAISMTFPLPVSYETRIRQVPGVTEVSAMNWFGGIYIDEKHFFPNFAVDPKTFISLYSEYVFPPGQLDAVLRDRRGAAVGRKLAERFGWKIGDVVTLKGTIYQGNWEFVIRMIYTGRDETADERLFFFHWDYLNETLKRTAPGMADHVGAYIVGIDRGDAAADVAAEIDRTFSNSMAETLTETEKAFNLSFISMADSIIMIVRLVSLIVIIIIIAVAANTMSMTTRERIGEFSVLKTLGFGAWRIAALIFGESLVISMTGCLFGITLTFPAASTFRYYLGSFFPAFVVTNQTVYFDVVAGLLVGLLAAIIPSWRSIRIKIADGLRRIG
jgi:putative ABC transport system permease protein